MRHGCIILDNIGHEIMDISVWSVYHAMILVNKVRYGSIKYCHVEVVSQCDM